MERFFGYANRSIQAKIEFAREIITRMLLCIHLCGVEKHDHRLISSLQPQFKKTLKFKIQTIFIGHPCGMNSAIS